MVVASMFGAHAHLLFHCLRNMLHELHRNLVALLQGIYCSLILSLHLRNEKCFGKIAASHFLQLRTKTVVMRSCLFRDGEADLLGE